MICHPVFKDDDDDDDESASKAEAAVGKSATGTTDPSSFFCICIVCIS